MDRLWFTGQRSEADIGTAESNDLDSPLIPLDFGSPAECGC